LPVGFSTAMGGFENQAATLRCFLVALGKRLTREMESMASQAGCIVRRPVRV
jgi:hypothetical protein